MLINSIYAVANDPHLQTIRNIEVLVHCIGIIPTRTSGMCTSNTICVYEIHVNDILTMQNPKLIPLLIIQLKDKLNYLECHSP